MPLTHVLDIDANTCAPGIAAKPKLSTKGGSSWLCTLIFSPAEKVSWPTYSSCSTDRVNFKPKFFPGLLTLRSSVFFPVKINDYLKILKKTKEIKTGKK